MNTRPAVPRQPVKWLSAKELSEITGCGRTWLYDRMKDKDDPFPRQILLSPRCARWKEDEVIAWMARQEARRAAAPDLLTQANDSQS